MSGHTLALQPVQIFAAPEPSNRVTPLFRDAPAAELALATARPVRAAVVVARYTDRIEHGTCALCWTGPAPMAGSVRRRNTGLPAGDVDVRNICSRCLVSLEMLAVQFDTELQLHIETLA